MGATRVELLEHGPGCVGLGWVTPPSLAAAGAPAATAEPVDIEAA